MVNFLLLIILVETRQLSPDRSDKNTVLFEDRVDWARESKTNFDARGHNQVSHTGMRSSGNQVQHQVSQIGHQGGHTSGNYVQQGGSRVERNGANMNYDPYNPFSN